MSTDVLQVFTYDPLPSPSSFRILELLPGTEDDDVAYSLVVVDWDSPPKYEAISYTWGDPEVKVATLCHGTYLGITPNLRDCFFHLRFEEKSRFLWADAVCIDQSNQDERGHQVSNMQKIYQRASNVIVWLGSEDPERAKQAIDLIEYCSRHILDEVHITEQDLESIPDLDDIIFKTKTYLGDLILPDYCAWASLYWFLRNPWFSRVWVIQEVNSQNRPSVIYERQQVNWHRLTLVATYISCYPSFYNSEYRFNNSNSSNAMLMRRPELRLGTNWLLILQQTTKFEASDPRDKIFGVLGLPNFAAQCYPLQADYSMALQDLFRLLVNIGIKNAGNLDILSFVQHRRKLKSPSWVARWDQPNVRHIFNTYDLNWNASNGSHPDVSIDHKNSILSTSGLIIETIRYCQRVELDALYADQENAEDKAHRREFWERLLRNTASLPLPDMLTPCAMALTCGLNKMAERLESEQFHRRGFARFLSTVFSDWETRYPEIWESARNAEGMASEFIDTARICCQNQSFFVAGNRYVGLGSLLIQEGDIVAILHGGRVPYILRPEGDHYLLVGDAYVYGIMDGEEFQKRDVAAETQMFRIH